MSKVDPGFSTCIHQSLQISALIHRGRVLLRCLTRLCSTFGLGVTIVSIGSIGGVLSFRSRFAGNHHPRLRQKPPARTLNRSTLSKLQRGSLPTGSHQTYAITLLG